MPKPPYPTKPFGRTKLYKWFDSIGLDYNHNRDFLHFSALVNYFPGYDLSGGHRKPSDKEIEDSREWLRNDLEKHGSSIIVPIGKLSIEKCFNVKNIKLTDYIGNIYNLNPYSLLSFECTVIPLPHPSGASTWVHKDENKKVLSKALSLIKANII